MNTHFFNGRLGSDAELKYTPNGTACAELSVAVSRKNGETYVTNWFKVALWGKTAEIWSPFCKKGSEVVVSGEAEEREWTGRDGQKRMSRQVNANFFRVCVSTRGQDDGGPGL
jgi:single-strand DNA-binding protein